MSSSYYMFVYVKLGLVRCNYPRIGFGDILEFGECSGLSLFDQFWVMNQKWYGLRDVVFSDLWWFLTCISYVNCTVVYVLGTHLRPIIWQNLPS